MNSIDEDFLPGKEYYEKKITYFGKKEISFDYYYRHTDGQLFYTTQKTLRGCRDVKEQWINNLKRG